MKKYATFFKITGAMSRLLGREFATQDNAGFSIQFDEALLENFFEADITIDTGNIFLGVSRNESDPTQMRVATTTAQGSVEVTIELEDGSEQVYELDLASVAGFRLMLVDDELVFDLLPRE